MLLVLLIATTSSCSSQPREQVVEGVRLWTHGFPSGAMEAGISGFVEYMDENDCFVLVPINDGGEASETFQPLVFPYGTTIRQVDPIVLRIPGLGDVQLGSEVNGGGGYVSAPQTLNIPLECSSVGTDETVLWQTIAALPAG